MKRDMIIGVMICLLAFAVGLTMAPQMVPTAQAGPVCGDCAEPVLCAKLVGNCVQYFSGTCRINGCCGTFLYQCCGAPC